MGKMCTIVATVLGSTLLLLSIVFIGASSRPEDSGRYGATARFGEREMAEEPAGWELVSTRTVAPMERLVHYDELRREKPNLELESMMDEDLNGENSHVVVQVYSVDSDQEVTNESSSSGPAVRTIKMHTYGKPKEQMEGRATDRVERKVFAPLANMQEQSAKVESDKVQRQPQQQQQQHQPAAKESLLQERFYVDDSTNMEQSAGPAARRRYSVNYGSNDDASEGADGDQPLPQKLVPARTQAVPPFYDYNEQTSQRMLDEFFALRNQDSLASRRSNYDWDEGQFRSRTLEEIRNQNRAAMTASRKKTPLDYRMGPTNRDGMDMGYDQYADYAEMEQRMANEYGSQKLGRRQRATPSDAGKPTKVLNHMPIVCPNGGRSVPSDGSAPSPIERSRFHYSLPSMVFNPYAWDPYHFNMLRFPQCNACQQNARALCGKCGLCADCCAHSKCTCGCLNG